MCCINIGLNSAVVMRAHLLVFGFVFILSLCVRTECQKRPRPVADGKRWNLNAGLQRSTAPARGITRSGRNGRNFARFSWNEFQKANDRFEKQEEKKKKAMRQLRAGTVHPSGIMGPPGPRGPTGPRGPKGANITKDEMFEEFRTMIDDLVRRKLVVGADPRCTELCVSNLKENATGPVAQVSLFADEQDFLLPKIVSAFMWELKEYFAVPKRSRVELDMFIQSFKPGAYGREIGDSQPTIGRFVAPRTGFYNFNVRIHLQLPVKSESESIRDNELFSIFICIDGSCKAKMMLEHISGFGPGDRMTVPLNGMLHLKKNEYVSLFIDNPSKHDLEVFDGSQFSGYLLGV